MDDLKKVLIVEYRDLIGDEYDWAFVTTSIEKAYEFMKANTDYDKSDKIWFWATYWMYIDRDSALMSDKEMDLNYYHFTDERAKDLDEVEELYFSKRKTEKRTKPNVKQFNENHEKVLVVEFRNLNNDVNLAFIASSEENAYKFMSENIDYDRDDFVWYWVTYWQYIDKPGYEMRSDDMCLTFYHFTGEKSEDIEEIKNLYIEKKKKLI